MLLPQWPGISSQVLAHKDQGLQALTWEQSRTMGLRVTLQEVAGHGVDLHGQLAGGRYDQRARAIARHELGPVHQLYAGHQERQRLSGPCMPLMCLSTGIDRASVSLLCSLRGGVDYMLIRVGAD